MTATLWSALFIYKSNVDSISREKQIRPICTDGYELRKNFLIHLLEYYANEAEDNIPYDVREILKCLK
ncbi:hypothetical protein ACQJBY_046108 [Aegilops geniculata]